MANTFAYLEPEDVGGFGKRLGSSRVKGLGLGFHKPFVLAILWIYFKV